jgi:arabinofuranosyltransferase
MPTGPTTRFTARAATWMVFGAVSIFYVVFIIRELGVVGGATSSTLFDDSMISMRYARNLIRGDGLVFNPGEDVEGYTNLLWTLLLAGVQLVVPASQYAGLAVSVVGLVLLVGQMDLARRITTAVTASPWAGTFAALCCGMSFSSVFWTLRGMEVGLIGFLALLAVRQVHELHVEWSSKRAALVGGIATALYFTRDDAALLAAAAIAAVVITAPAARKIRTARVAAAGVMLVIGARLALRFAMYGEWLPNTYVLKVGGISRSLLVQRGLLTSGYTLVLGSGVAVLLAVAARRAATSSAGRSTVQLLASIVAIQVVYSVSVGGDAWEDSGLANRFFASVAGCLAVLAVCGVVAIHRGLRPPRWAVYMVAGGVLAFAAAVPQTSMYFKAGSATGIHTLFQVTVIVVTGALMLCERARRATTVALCATVLLAANVGPLVDWVNHGAYGADNDLAWARYGDALATATAPTAVVAASSIGNLGFYSDRPLVDILGKVDPVVAHSRPRTELWVLPGHMKWDYLHSLGERRPDVVSQLFFPTKQDMALLASYGYVSVGGAAMLHVQPESTLVDRRAMEAVVRYAR